MPNYNSDILNYYNDDSHVGKFKDNDKNVGTGLVGSPSCGDVMKLQVKIKKDDKTKTEKIVDAKILVFGCGSAKASSSYVAKQLIGKTIDDALKIKNTDIAKYLGLPKIKLHCSVLAESAIKRAIEDYKTKNNKKNNDKKIDKKTKKIVNRKNEVVFFVTKPAISFIKKYLSKKKDIDGICIFLEESNCGLAYKVSLIKKNNKNVNQYFSKKISNIKFFIKKNEIEILNGTKIDLKKEGLKEGLIFKNPRETSKCNCGMSFSIKKIEN